MDPHHLRAIILKLQDSLSDNDRKRLHFFLGPDVPRRIRDDQSLSGTLSLMESLLDQDKINERDFTFLINAFDEIQCQDAVKLLREHMRRMQASGQNESIQSLSSMLLQDQDEDKFVRQNLIINQRNNYGDNNIMIDSNNKNVNQMTTIVDKQSSGLSRKRLFKLSTMTTQVLLLFAGLLIIVLAGVAGVYIKQYNKSIEQNQRLTKDLIICEQQNRCSNFVKKENWDYYGNDIDSEGTRQTNYADCCAQCFQDHRCIAFTWRRDQHRCFIKSSIGGKGGNYDPKSDAGHLRVGHNRGEIQWNGNNWAHACDFHERNLVNVTIASELCGTECARTKDCTHFTWTQYKGGTCWLKTGTVSKSNAFFTNDQTMLCGVVIST